MVVTDRTCPICRKFFASNANFTIHLNRQKPCISPEASAILGPCPKNFKCHQCQSLFKTTQKLNAHMNRKKPCKAELSESQMLVEQLQIEKEQLNKELKQKKTIIEELQSNTQSNVMNNSHNTTNNDNSTNDNSTNDNRTNNDNSTTNNNTANNNFHIHVSGQEDLSHITSAMYKQCFSNPHKSIERLFEMIHFSEKMPQNANLYVSNADTGHITTLGKTGWKKGSQGVILENKYFDVKDVLRNAFDAMRGTTPKTISPRLEEYFSPFVDNYIEEDFEKQIIKASCDEMMYMAYNNRYKPMKMHREMEKEKNNKT